MIPVRLLEERIDIAIIFTDLVVHLPNVGFRESEAGDEGFESRGLLLLLAPLVVGFVGRVLFEFGWGLAAKKKFGVSLYGMCGIVWLYRGSLR
jgi:hypothetical protein